MRTSYDTVNEPDVPKPVLHIVANLDGKHVDGHNRLRVEVDEKDVRIGALERQAAELSESMKNAFKRTTDIQQLRFTPAMFAATVALCVSIVGGFYAATSGLKESGTATNTQIKELGTNFDQQIKKLTSDMDFFTKDIQSKMLAQADLARADARARDDRDAANAKLADERNTNLSKAVAAIDVKVNMQDLKMNNLRETVLSNGPKREQ